MAHKLYLSQRFEIDGREGTINQLIGRFAFVQQIDQFNNYLSYKKSLIKNNFDAQKYLIEKIREKSESKILLEIYFLVIETFESIYIIIRDMIHNLPKGFYTIGKEEKKCICLYLILGKKNIKSFLFYRYFYGNDKPIIVTEGKLILDILRSH